MLSRGLLWGSLEYLPTPASWLQPDQASQAGQSCQSPGAHTTVDVTVAARYLPTSLPFSSRFIPWFVFHGC
jgi:hypothetical protein